MIYGANYQLQLDSVPGRGHLRPHRHSRAAGAGEDERVTEAVSTLRTVVVDDEQLARDEVCFLLGEIGGVEVVGQAANGVEALQVIEAESPDLVMLDVQMPGLRASKWPGGWPKPAATRSWCSSRPSTSTRSRRSR